MFEFPAIPKPLLMILAVIFAAATILYSALWIRFQYSPQAVRLGFDNYYQREEQAEVITGVYQGSPAERAGLRVGDRLQAVDGERLESAFAMNDIWARHKPGDAVELTIRRPQITELVTIHAVFETSPSPGGKLTEHLGRDIINAYPLAFLIVGLTVLFLRVDNSNAWLLALMFAGAIAVPDFPGGFHSTLGIQWRRFAMADRGIFSAFNPALFYIFFAVFPVRSPLERRLPWLKWVALAAAIFMAIPGLRIGAYATPAAVEKWLGAGAARLIRLSYGYGFLALGLVSLIANGVGASTPEARRKIRVILWGTLVGIVPIWLALGAQEFFGYQITLWVAAPLVLLVYLFPLSFAYAVVKHRVLEIPVLLKRSARYLLVQRGFVLLSFLVGIGAVVAFIAIFTQLFGAHPEKALPVGLLFGVVFGVVWTVGGLQLQRRVGRRIDRAFFRNAYDARTILEDLVEKTRTAGQRSELAALLDHHLRQALQPASFAVYLETGDGRLEADGPAVPPALRSIAAANPTFAPLAPSGRLWDVAWQGAAEGSPPAALAALQPDCLVPILGRDGRLAGLIVLGQRLSEEAYSREDKQLLTAVASQVGSALEGIRLGERIAERLEAERHAAREMEFARQVQARLFPQKLPAMRNLEYSGLCVQARQVGGDYYDFLELAPGRLALVLADIAGKGVSGALLMANLQANLRSQYATALEDLPGLLKSVNQLFFENTTESSYATLFFGDYDDSTGRLRYANCGHLPPLLLRAGRGSLNQAAGTQPVELLHSTCTVVGLFEQWPCQVAEVCLNPGDTLAVYTDGVTEAENSAGEEFGQGRLLAALARLSQLSVDEVLHGVVEAVNDFSGGHPQDDVTLLIARRRA